jgi:hypothetical protein
MESPAPPPRYAHGVKTGLLLSVGSLALAVLGLSLLRPGSRSVDGVQAPPFPSARPADWIGPPQSWPALRGKVVLLDVWTFG